CCSVWARMPPSWPSRSPAADRLACLGLPECADQPCLHRPTAGGPPPSSLRFSTALCPIGFRADLGRQDTSPKGNPMTRRAVSSDQAPAALGPYSQAIVAGGFVFCSGTAGIDPAAGPVGDGIEAQTEQALQNLAAVLEAAGASMADLVKVTIFYADVDDFARLNEVYARHMPDPPPARSAPANGKLPRGLLISIDAIAALPAENYTRVT